MGKWAAKGRFSGCTRPKHCPLHYKTFTSVDFALDERFREWVKKPTPASNTFWSEFLRQYPHQHATMAEARQLVAGLKVNVSSATPEQLAQLWNRISVETDARLPTSVQSDRVIKRWLIAPLLRRAAMGAGLLLLAGLAWYRFGPEDTTRYATAYGETRTVSLPDGSVVTLNGHSTLTVANHWQQGEDRNVTLNGEAFFVVAKQKAPNGRLVKFRVKTPGLAIDVLGTRFNVNYRRQTTEVVLQEGHVRVLPASATGQEDARPALMQPGEMLTYSETSHRLTKTAVDADAVVAWQKRLLIFSNRPVADIIQMITDNYGIDVDIRNQAVGARRFSGSFPADSVAVFFEKLEKMYGVTVRQTGRRYSID